jgi:hypothetical protein
VFISGTFNQWSERVPMHKQIVPDRENPSKMIEQWQVQLPLSPGFYALRFIVEGKWQISPRLPTRSDEQGNQFNAILVKPRLQPTPPEDSDAWNTKPVNFHGVPTELPNELTKSHLDIKVPRGTDPFLLTIPPAATVHHLFVILFLPFLSETWRFIVLFLSIPVFRYIRPDSVDRVVSSSMTTRVRSKFITSVLYMPLQHLASPS